MTEYLGRAIEEFKKDVLGYVLVTLIYLAVLGAVQFAIGIVAGIMQVALMVVLQKAFENNPEVAQFAVIPIKLGASLITSVVTVPLLLGYYFAIKQRITQGTMNYADVFKGFNFLVPGYVSIIVRNIIIFIGVILFIIPRVLK